MIVLVASSYPHALYIGKLLGILAGALNAVIDPVVSLDLAVLDGGHAARAAT